MNGAQALIRTLVDSEVDVCFTNPGTSEMHFVAAVDQVPEMRTILGLFEGVVTGGRIDPLPIAIAPFLAGGGAEETGGTLSGVITNNLGRSGYFAPLDPATFIEQVSNFELSPNFASWQQIKAKALVTGQAYMDGGKMHGLI